MKIAPLFHALKRIDGLHPFLVHTGQHYDLNMSDTFFADLHLPAPDLHLGVGSGTHAQQTGRVMIAYEKQLLDDPPNLVVVVGDVNSTIAAILAAAKLGIATAHLEAGLRSFDRSMPEEINRLVTDSLADLLWTSSQDADANLLREGVAPEKIVRVGNIMIDSLEMMRTAIEKEAAYRQFGFAPRSYGLVTLHRPTNVDRPERLTLFCNEIAAVASVLPLVFPVHPRTMNNLKRYDLLSKIDKAPGIVLSSPLNYVRFMSLVFNCRLVITDSGGMQEETTYLKIPCLTLRPNTERPITITHGTNQLCRIEDLVSTVRGILHGPEKKASVPDLWDGRTAERVINSVLRFAETKQWNDSGPPGRIAGESVWTGES